MLIYIYVHNIQMYTMCVQSARHAAYMRLRDRYYRCYVRDTWLKPTKQRVATRVVLHSVYAQGLEN